MNIGILWDLDGTLLDTLEDLTDAVNHTLAAFHCPERTLDEVRRFVGNGAARLIQLSLPGKDTDPDWREVLAAYQVYYAAHAQEETAPYAGIPEALASLGKKYPMAVVSNKPDGAVKLLCADYFGNLQARGESDDCPRKPAPDMLYKAMQQLGVDTCIYVGDSEVDVTTAQNAGVPCLSVTWGFRDSDVLIQAGAKHLCHAVADLESCLDRIAAEMA